MTSVQLSTMRFQGIVLYRIQENALYRKEALITRPELHTIPDGSEPLHPFLPGSICADHGCDLVHPGTTHDAYAARFAHALTCQACRQADVVGL
jgi:hypothetical protein